MSGETAAGTVRGDALDPVSRILTLAAVLLGLYLFLGRLGSTPIQRGNEAVYASPPITMLETGDYLLPVYLHKPFLDKPPMTFWILAATYRLLGVAIATSRLPAALACLATILLVGVRARRRAGSRAGVLAALILMFTFALSFSAVIFAADAFLMLAVTIAVFTLDAACRQESGTAAGRGIRVGAALAFAYSCKGLVGVVLPVGGVALGLLVDRVRPFRPWRRGAWALAALLVLLVPWHWAMSMRLGAAFWDMFLWKNQILRASTRIYMMPHRGLLYYLGIMAWAIFPWSLAIPAAWRMRRDGMALGWFVFGFAFFSLLVMKRESYLLPIYPAIALLCGEGLAGRSEAGGVWRRTPWLLAAAAASAAFIAWLVAFANLDEVGGSGATLTIGAALAALAVTAGARVRFPTDFRPLVGSALSCGVLLLGLELFDARLARFDPLPAWGERIRGECAGGCDLFLIGVNASSLTFYSRSDWFSFPEIPPDLFSLREHRSGFLVVRSIDEPRLPPLPPGSGVVDRKPVIAKPRLLVAADRREAFESLSLVRLGAPKPTSQPGR